MADYQVRYADLEMIERNIKRIAKNMEVVNNNMETVNTNVGVLRQEVHGVNRTVDSIQGELQDLANQFLLFVEKQMHANRLGQAETRIVQLRQELEKRFGHYDAVRRTTIGILQADDLGLVRKETVNTITEELMLSAPQYWLAPCLVALAAWIDDNPQLAEKAVREALKRDDEKTSLFFALVCRRADRKTPSLKWVQRYLANQNEEQLERKVIIVLDAYTGGLFGADTEGLVTKQINEWLDHLTAKPGFVEDQISQWSNALYAKRQPYEGSSYVYLKKYSPTWSLLQHIMEGALLHDRVWRYFEGVFAQEPANLSLKGQLDGILSSLVTNFDDEELPIRKQEKYEQLVIQFFGDEDKAMAQMALEQTSFQTESNFTQILTDAAMNADISHASVSTQKYAIALSKEWISTAYRNLIAENRAKIPYMIALKVDGFEATTANGENELELVQAYEEFLEQEKQGLLSKLVIGGMDGFIQIAGVAVILLGAYWAMENQAAGLISAIFGMVLIMNGFSKKKRIAASRQSIKEQYEERKKKGSQIIRAVVAEVVDFRAEFAEHDAQSDKVIAFLDQISTEQHIQNRADSVRRVKI